MPFALGMMAVVTSKVDVTLSQVIWILICLVSARTGAMALNRAIDHKIDSMNPRTKNREVPAGVVSVGSVWALLILAYGIFIYSAAMLGVHTLMLAIPVLVILSFYSWTKRFTSYSHIFLGLALALAPGGVWYALVGTVEMLPIWLMLGVLFWVAGFDIIYSCQDAEFDRAQGLFSIPSRVGIPMALRISFGMHLVSILFMILFGLMAQLGIIFFAGVLLFGILVISQHRLVRADDLSRVNEAFFVRNGLGSFIFFLGALFDRIIG
jgi:4-hydroxybenzoate polyprenyltransferase